MTNEGTDAGVGGLARKYADVKRKLACVKDRLAEHQERVSSLHAALKVEPIDGFDWPKKACSEIHWPAIQRDVSLLSELGAEKARLEDALQEVGLGNLIKG